MVQEALVGNIASTAALDAVVDREMWLALFHTMPTLEVPLANEIFGAGMVRPFTAMERTSARRIANAEALLMSNVPQTTVRAVGLITAPENGELVLAERLTNPYQVSASGILVYQPGDIVFTM